MRKKRRDASELELPMDPMVDIVFQLIIFFLFTFQIKVMEDMKVAELTQPGIVEKGEPPPVLMLKSSPENPKGLAIEVLLNDKKIEAGIAGIAERLSQLKQAEFVALVPEDRIIMREVVNALAEIKKTGWKPKLAWEFSKINGAKK